MQKSIFSLLVFLLPVIFSEVTFGVGVAYDEKSLQWKEGYTSEIWECSLRENASMSALLGVIDGWNAYADKAGFRKYNANILIPIFSSDLDIEKTILWYGKWEPRAAGKDIDALLASGNEIQSQFQPVITCKSRVLYGSWDIRNKLKPKKVDNKIVSISECKYVSDWDNQRGLLKTRGDDDLASANGELNKFYDENDADFNITQLWPWKGRSKNELSSTWDIKWVEEYRSADHMIITELDMANNGIFEIETKAIDPVINCKDPEVFQARSIRGGAGN